MQNKAEKLFSFDLNKLIEDAKKICLRNKKINPKNLLHRFYKEEQLPLHMKRMFSELSTLQNSIRGDKDSNEERNQLEICLILYKYYEDYRIHDKHDKDFHESGKKRWRKIYDLLLSTYGLKEHYDACFWASNNEDLTQMKYEGEDPEQILPNFLKEKCHEYQLNYGSATQVIEQVENDNATSKP